MMKVSDLKDSVNSICMKDEMRKSIIENVDKRVEKNNHAVLHTDRRNLVWRRVTATAVLIVALGIIAFPVRAFVNSFVRERLEAMPEEEVDAILDTEMSIRAEANSFTRDYTDKEKVRYQILLEEYQSGTFPEKEISKADSIESVNLDETCFIIPEGTFYLPERELTDEEILEIIDFDVKRNYALEQNYIKENADEIAQKEEEQREQVANNIASGGITEQQALETATEKLYEFFGNRGEGMELRCWYSESSVSGASVPCYSINWTNEVTHKIYYIDISAQDGRVLWAAQTDPQSVDMSDIPIGEAEEKIVTLQNQAEEFMKKVGISYENVYVYYLESTGGVVYRDGVRFVFETPGQSAHGVTYQWDGVLKIYAEVDFADYQDRDGKIRVMHLRGEEVEMKQVFQELNQK